MFKQFLLNKFLENSSLTEFVDIDFPDSTSRGPIGGLNNSPRKSWVYLANHKARDLNIPINFKLTENGVCCGFNSIEDAEKVFAAMQSDWPEKLLSSLDGAVGTITSFAPYLVDEGDDVAMLNYITRELRIIADGYNLDYDALYERFRDQIDRTVKVPSVKEPSRVVNIRDFQNDLTL